MALKDLIRPAPTPAAERPPGITCETYTSGEGKRCKPCQPGGPDTSILPAGSPLPGANIHFYWEGRPDETHALLTRLQAALAAPIVESGDEAHMPYGPEQEVFFVREDGVWRIESTPAGEQD